MPAVLAGMPHRQSNEAGDGRYRSYLVAKVATRPAATKPSAKNLIGFVHGAHHAPDAAAPFEHRTPDVPAADPDHRLPCGLSGALFDLSIHSARGSSALYRFG